MVVANGGTGGMQAQVSLQARLLAARGHEAHVAVGGGSGNGDAGVTSHDLPTFSPRSLSFIRQLATLVHRLQPDVVHAHGLRLAPALVLAGIGRTRVLECHGLDPRGEPAAAWRSLRAAVRAGVRVAACGSGPASLLASELGDVDVINNLLPDSPVARDPRRDFPISADTRIAIWPARFSEQKGHSRLVDLMSILDDPRLAVICVGDGPLRHDVEADIARRGMSDRIICGDYSTMAGQWLAGSDLFIMPSWWEGQPTVGLEALGAGLPIVSLTLLGDEDVVVEGTGIRAADIHDAAEILRQWLDDPRCQPHDENVRRGLLARHGAEEVARDLSRVYGVEL